MTDEDNKYVTLSLTKKQASFVLESLLYAGSINVGADWDYDDINQIIETALQINSQIDSKSLELNNLTYFEEDGFTEPHTDVIKSVFGINVFSKKDACIS